eukprot:jgi/Botrbrau1/7410/Bobra.0112s0010.1
MPPYSDTSREYFPGSWCPSWPWRRPPPPNPRPPSRAWRQEKGAEVQRRVRGARWARARHCPMPSRGSCWSSISKDTVVRIINALKEQNAQLLTAHSSPPTKPFGLCWPSTC